MALAACGWLSWLKLWPRVSSILKFLENCMDFVGGGNLLDVWVRKTYKLKTWFLVVFLRFCLAFYINPSIMSDINHALPMRQAPHAGLVSEGPGTSILSTASPGDSH